MLDDTQAIKSTMLSKIEEVCWHLYPNGKIVGNEFCIGSVHGESGKSLKINIGHEKTGVFSDFSTGESGDILTLWELAKGKSNFAETIEDVKNFIGVNPLTAPIKRLKEKAKIQNLGSELDHKMIKGSNVWSYLTKTRGLLPEIIDMFLVGEENDNICFKYYIEDTLKMVKYLALNRHNGKKTTWMTKDCEHHLFGWHLIGDNCKSVTICEGEIDAMSLFQYGYSALSVPIGTGTGSKQKWIELDFDRLQKFDEIFLCFDEDDVFDKTITDISQRLGKEKCRILRLPKKDPNECVKSGVSDEEIKKQYWSAERCLPPTVCNVKDFFEEYLIKSDPSYIDQGYSMGWSKCENRLKFRHKEMTVWTGVNGHGKSQFLGQMALNFIEQGANVLVVSLELPPEKLIHRMVKQATTEKVPSLESKIKSFDWWGENFYIYNKLSNINIDEMLEHFKYSRRKYGVDVFIIDSFMRLGCAEDDLAMQKKIIDKLDAFKLANDCHIHLVAHPRKVESDYSRPGKMDVKGTGALTDAPDNVVSVWRNLLKEESRVKEQYNDPMSQDELNSLSESDIEVKCYKQRFGDWTGLFKFWFDLSSYQYLEHEDSQLKKYLK